MSLEDAVQQVVQRWARLIKPDVIGQLPSRAPITAGR